MKFKYFGPGKPPAAAFTIHGDGLFRSIQSHVLLTEAFDPKTQPVPAKEIKYVALWDTGATGSVISPKVVEDLGLPVIGRRNVTDANRTMETTEHLVNIMMPNSVGVVGVAVTKNNLTGFDVLIGMDIIKYGDFVLTNYKGKSVFTFRVPSLEKIDFTKEINEEKIRWEAHNSTDGQRKERDRKKQGMRKPKRKK